MKSNKKIWTGFFIGFITAMVLSVGVNLIITSTVIKKQRKELDEKYGTEQADNTTESGSGFAKLNVLDSIISKYYLNDYDKEELLQGAYKGYVSALGDPYSVYYTKEEYDKFMEQSSGVYYGIGVQVSQNINTGIITATKVFPDCPGEEAGMLPGDIITKVAGQSVDGMDLTSVVALIKGDEGTYVDIQVFRESANDYVELHVERRKVEYPTVEYTMLENNMGYISLTGFEEVTAAQFKNALDDLKNQGMTSLIVDVRDNPGGLLTSVNDILSNILPKGTIVYTEDKNGNKKTYECDGKNELNIPLVVLTNGNSASASEIFAGAIKDYKKGTLVGTKTFGKGIVQTIVGLTDGSAVKVTISKYFTPSGVNIHGTGIEPDVTVELDDDVKNLIVIPEDKDNQLQKAIEILNGSN